LEIVVAEVLVVVAVVVVVVVVMGFLGTLAAEVVRACRMEKSHSDKSKNVSSN
jgi:hypothetical protein